MSFVPPVFSKFGKNVSDLLKKKFEGDNTIKYVRKNNELTVEQGVLADGSARGFIKAKYADKKTAEYEVELHTADDSNSKASAKFTSLIPKSAVTVEVNSKDKDKTFKGAVAKAEVEFSQEYVSTTLAVKSDLSVHKVDVSGSVGFDGLSVGGAVTINATGSTQIANVNAGVEYAKKDYAVSAYSEKNGEDVNVALWYRHNASLALVGQAKVGLRQLNTDVTVAADYALDAKTQLKAKAELPAGVVAIAVEQRLANPALAFALTGSYDASAIAAGNVRAKKFGFAATFGDY